MQPPPPASCLSHTGWFCSCDSDSATGSTCVCGGAQFAGGMSPASPTESGGSLLITEAGLWLVRAPRGSAPDWQQETESREPRTGYSVARSTNDICAAACGCKSPVARARRGCAIERRTDEGTEIRDRACVCARRGRVPPCFCPARRRRSSAPSRPPVAPGGPPLRAPFETGRRPWAGPRRRGAQGVVSHTEREGDGSLCSDPEATSGAVP